MPPQIQFVDADAHCTLFFRNSWLDHQLLVSDHSSLLSFIFSWVVLFFGHFGESFELQDMAIGSLNYLCLYWVILGSMQ
jgi:hypothetical protein